jgi:UDP-N-acetylglucosamine 2-epimerase (non-hydrolysing)
MIVAGTRPEAVKIAPVIWWLNRLGVNYVFVWSGQHHDYEMSQIFFDQLQLPEPDEYLNLGIGAHDVARQMAILLQEITDVAKRQDPKLIYALGDTNTTLASALASVYANKPFVHDEAGMRSFDDSMLEEVNRRVADAVANIRLAPTKIAVLNLLYEGIPQSTIRLVGSTAVDTLLYTLSRNLLKNEVFDNYHVSPSQYLLFTIHRRENLTKVRLHRITSILMEVARRLPDHKIIFPVHPHTKKRIEEEGLTEKFNHYNNIQLVKPLGYFEFISLLKCARVVVTDSGGVQEEAFVLGKRIVTLRKTTEWPETVILSYNCLVDPDDINEAVNVIIKSVDLPEPSPPQLSTCPLGDGKAGRRIAKLLQLLSEAGIMRGLEISKYPLTHLVARFSARHQASKIDYLTTIYRESNHLDRGPITGEDLMTDKELLRFIKVDWAKVDKSMEGL